MRGLVLATTLIIPTLAFAVDTEDSKPPTQTNTTATCENGMVWDEKAEECVKIQDSRLDNDTLYQTAREFAYAGQYNNALSALSAMDEGESDRVLTYFGFTHRKKGELEAALQYYRAALAKNPDNILARSYMGQGFVDDGKLDLAKAELSEIRKRQGRGTWAEFALRMAIETKHFAGY